MDQVGTFGTLNLPVQESWRRHFEYLRTKFPMPSGGRGGREHRDKKEWTQERERRRTWRRRTWMRRGWSKDVVPRGGGEEAANAREHIHVGRERIIARGERGGGGLMSKWVREAEKKRELMSWMEFVQLRVGPEKCQAKQMPHPVTYLHIFHSATFSLSLSVDGWIFYEFLAKNIPLRYTWC